MPAIEPCLSQRALTADRLTGDVLVHLSPQSQTESPIMETTIRVDNAVTSLVNVFTVEPENQSKVFGLLREGIEIMFSKMPGWISSNLLRSRDGKQVVVYSQWRDASDIDTFRQDPRMKPYFQKFGALARHESFTCDVTYSLHA